MPSGKFNPAYTSVNTLIAENDSELVEFPTKFLDSSKMSGLPIHKLELKEGCIVMLRRNLNLIKKDYSTARD